MKLFHYLLFLIALHTIAEIGFCQEIPRLDRSLIKRENIEFEALKPCFYLIRQDYIILSNKGDSLKLGGNDFFGKGVGMGFLIKDGRILFPNFIRYPWERDNNYEEYRKTHKPKCTYIKVKNIQDSVYRIFNYQDFDTSQAVLNLAYGNSGIPITEKLIDRGSLIIFYSSIPIPEKIDDISYSIIYLDNIIWDQDKVAEVRKPYLGNQEILGGGIFERIIKKGSIEWKMAGIYIPVEGKWIISSIY